LFWYASIIAQTKPFVKSKKREFLANFDPILGSKKPAGAGLLAQLAA